MLITCPECGKQISEQAESCPHCGRPLEEEERAEIAERAKRGQVTAALVGGGFVIGLVVLFAWLFGGLDHGGTAPESSTAPTARTDEVETLLAETMGTPEAKKAVRSYKYLGTGLVEVEMVNGFSDSEIEEFVRALTGAIHRKSSDGRATVWAYEAGIEVAEGDYSVWDGSIRVKLLR